MSDDFHELLARSSLGQKFVELKPIAWPNSFREDRGRSFHAHHKTAEDRFGHSASSLCGINLRGSLVRLEGEFPPKNKAWKPCTRCLHLSDPVTLPVPAFQLLQRIIANQPLGSRDRKPLNQLIERDLVEGSGNQYRPTKLGWLNVVALRNHPAFDSELLENR